MKNQSENAKFEQISPVLELIYLMVTNMQKYLRVYAEDTQAENLKEYKETHEALQNLRRVLDRIYGIEEAPQARQNAQKQAPQQQAPHSAAETRREVESAFQGFTDSSPSVFSEPTRIPQGMNQPQVPPMPQNQPQAPQIFSQQNSVQSQPQAFGPQTSVPNPEMDEFVLPARNSQQSQQFGAPQQPQQPMNNEPAPQMSQAPAQPQQQQTQPQASQASEIDSILAELRKLQANNRDQ